MDEQQKKDQLTIQRITQSMLNDGKCVEELFHRLDRKGDEPFLHTYLRVVSDESGMTIGGKQYTHEEMLLFFNSVDSPSEELELPLAKRVSMSDIQSDLNKYLNTTWKDLSYEQKLGVLWEYGLNVLKESEDSSKYWVTRCIHRNRDNKIVDGLCIIASERTDKEWIMTPMASYEAKVYTKDVEMMRDIDRMGAY